MKKILLFLLYLFLGVPSVMAQTDMIRLQYVEPSEGEDVSTFYGVNVYGAFQNRHYTLRMVHCVKGEPIVTVLNEVPFELKDTVQFFNFRANLYKRDSVRFAIEQANIPEASIRMENITEYILMETYPEKPFALTDTIPLMAFTTGIKSKIMFEGKEAECIYYCGLRDANKHPSEWYKLFNIQDYVYFELCIE